MMAAHFEGRVSHFITLNEPQIVLKLGYADGIHAPGKRLSLPELVSCWKTSCWRTDFPSGPSGKPRRKL